MRWPKLAALALACLSMSLLLAPGGALAAVVNHPFLGVGSGRYEDACGLALDNGSLFVSDFYHDAIDLPGGGTISPAGGPCKLALDSAGDLYVNEWHRAVVKYEASELVAGTGQVIDEAEPTGVAVERSSGDVFVAHRTYVAEYSSAGALLATIGAGHLGEAYGVAVSEFPATAGFLYVPDAAADTVKVFNPTASLTAPVAELDGAGTPQEGFRDLVDSEVVVDNNPESPSYGHVYVLDAVGHGLSEHPAGVLDEFNAAGEYRGQITGFTDAEPSGVAIGEGGNVAVTSGNSEGSAVFTYGPTAPAMRLAVTHSGAGGGSVNSSPVGIRCESACAAEFNEGQTVTLFAIPDAHSALAGWSVSGAEPCPGKGSCTVLMSANAEVTADFEAPTQETLTVATTGAGQGSVSSEPAGVLCPTNCEEHFAQGRQVTLTATPGAHSRFVGWGGPDCDESTQLTCKVEMTSAKALSAKFEPIPQLSLGVSRTGDGQGTVTSFPPGISCPGACSGQFDEGSTTYLLAAPAPGSGFAGFSGAGCIGTATICAVPMSAAQSVRAEFTGGARGPGGGAAAVASSLRVSVQRADGRSAAVTVTSGEPGTLVASGADLAPRERVIGAGATTLRLKLNRRGSRLLRHRHQLRASVTLGFLPAAAAAGTTRRLTLRFGGVRRGNLDRKGR